jgi:hypothetical protein
MDLNQKYFTHIVRGASQGVGFFSRFELFCQPVIRYFEVTVDIEENVLWFEVPVDIAEFMEVVDSQEDLSCVELGSWLFEPFALPEVGEHLSASDEVHHKEDLLLGLESKLQLDQKGVVTCITPNFTFFKEVTFCSSFAEMFFLNQILLSHALDRIVFLVLLVLTQHHLSEGPPTQHLEQLKLLETVDVVLIALALENNFALGFDLVVLLDAFGVEEKRLDGVEFLDVFADLVDGGGVLFQGEIVVVVERHL